MAILKSWLDDGTITPEILRSTGIDLDNVVVEVFPSPKNNQIGGNNLAAEIFTEINRAEPIQLIDLPDAAISPEHISIISSASNRLKALYPDMFKVSIHFVLKIIF